MKKSRKNILSNLCPVGIFFRIDVVSPSHFEFFASENSHFELFHLRIDSTIRRRNEFVLRLRYEVTFRCKIALNFSHFEALSPSFRRRNTSSYRLRKSTAVRRRNATSFRLHKSTSVRRRNSQKPS